MADLRRMVSLLSRALFIALIGANIFVLVSLALAAPEGDLRPGAWAVPVVLSALPAAVANIGVAANYLFKRRFVIASAFLIAAPLLLGTFTWRTYWVFCLPWAYGWVASDLVTRSSSETIAIAPSERGDGSQQYYLGVLRHAGPFSWSMAREQIRSRHTWTCEDRGCELEWRFPLMPHYSLVAWSQG